jgi:hypothetical protein
VIEEGSDLLITEGTDSQTNWMNKPKLSNEQSFYC